MSTELNLTEERSRKASTSFIDERGCWYDLLLSDRQADEALKFCCDLRDAGDKQYITWLKVTNPETNRRVFAVLSFESVGLEGGGHEIGGIRITIKR